MSEFRVYLVREMITSVAEMAQVTAVGEQLKKKHFSVKSAKHLREETYLAPIYSHDLCT